MFGHVCKRYGWVLICWGGKYSTQRKCGGIISVKDFQKK
jgi:hypothetical protein